jgi:HAD superfamily hydrolase (TIGR01509 family)
MRLKVVLFDIDDTLFDRQAAQIICLDQLTAAFKGILDVFDRVTLLKAWSASDRVSIEEFNAGSFDRASRSRHFLEFLGLPSEYTRDISAFFWQVFPSINTPVPGARALVTSLAGNYRLGIISNSWPDIQYAKIRTLALDSFFSCVVLSEELGVRKPAPAIFHLAAARLDLTPGDCLYVGDSFAIDVVGARNSGMSACWFNRSAQSIPPGSALIPDFNVSQLDQIGPLLRKPGLID